MSVVIGAFFESGCDQQPNPTEEHRYAANALLRARSRADFPPSSYTERPKRDWSNRTISLVKMSNSSNGLLFLTATFWQAILDNLDEKLIALLRHDGRRRVSSIWLSSSAFRAPLSGHAWSG